jgi:hypothetical protein
MLLWKVNNTALKFGEQALQRFNVVARSCHLQHVNSLAVHTENIKATFQQTL